MSYPGHTGQHGSQNGQSYPGVNGNAPQWGMPPPGMPPTQNMPGMSGHHSQPVAYQPVNGATYAGHPPRQPIKMAPPPPTSMGVSTQPPQVHAQQGLHPMPMQQSRPPPMSRPVAPPSSMPAYAPSAPPAMPGRAPPTSYAAPPPVANHGQGYSAPAPLQQQQFQPPPMTMQPGQMAPPRGGAFPSNLPSQFSDMSLQQSQSNPINLMQSKEGAVGPGKYCPMAIKYQTVAPPGSSRIPPNRANCDRDVMCSTLNAIPSSDSLCQKAKLPFGLLLHPYKDLQTLPVITTSNIVRCRSCRAYINPFVSFVDVSRWKCNLCGRINEVPEEFKSNPISKGFC